MAKKRKPPKRRRNYRVIYVYVSKKTRRQVKAAYARRRPHSVVRQRRYISLVRPGRMVRFERTAQEPNVQLMLELHPSVSHDGAESQLEHLESYQGQSFDEIRALSRNYQRWFLYIWKHNPELLSPSMKDSIIKEYHDPRNKDTYFRANAEFIEEQIAHAESIHAELVKSRPKPKRKSPARRKRRR